jgi:hypothetical protein
MSGPDAAGKPTPPVNLRALLVVFVAIAVVLYPLGQSLRDTFVPNYFLGLSSAFWAGICLGFAAMSAIAAGRTVIGLLRGEGKPRR